MITKTAISILKAREFVSVATADSTCLPNAAPKFVLKVEDNFIYLVDYTIGKTWENLRVNPRASLSFTDADTLTGYQINGPVEIIEKGAEYERILKELQEKEISLATARIIEGIHREKKHAVSELEIPQRFVIFKIKITDVAEIGLQGQLKREKI